MKLRLRDGNRVCIIGGSPAGSLAALHLLGMSQEQGKSLEVLIFEPRDFARPGPMGCNHCADIISSRLQRGLKPWVSHFQMRSSRQKFRPTRFT